MSGGAMRKVCLAIAVSTLVGASPLRGQAVRPLTLRAEREPSSGLTAFAAPAPQIADSKDPTLAGILSFLIPGVGSFYAGNGGHGIRHLGLHLGSYVLIGAAVASCDYDCSGSGGLVLLGSLALLGNDVWSIFTAVNDAKGHNGAAPGRVVGSLYLSPGFDGLRDVERPDGHGTAAAIRLIEWKF